MKDLTRGSITAHILAMAAPMAVGMLVQTLYVMVDLYFVAGRGQATLAGVSAAGNFTLVVLAMTQVLSVGTVALIAHAVGAGDRDGASLAFNQSLALGALASLVALAAGYALIGPYMAGVGADAATAAAGTSYLRWYLPGLALQFGAAAMAAALRGTGIAKPTMLVQLASVLLNIVLAPVLIAGVGTGHPLGAAGAGLASTLAVLAGTLLLVWYFARLEKYVGFRPAEWRPRPAVWRRILAIGLPAGGEFALMFVYMAVIYAIVARFGAAAQAGFGVGSRVMQAVFLPAMAIAFAITPVAGQNVGARNAARVRRSFVDGALLTCALMVLLTALCQWRAPAMVGFFTADPEARAVGTRFLQLISWNFVGSALVFSCSGMFQALGNTWPSIASSGTRLLTFAIPAWLWSTRPGFVIDDVWYLSIATVALQALVSLALLRRELARRLAFAAA
ncbi:MAG: MATE family efflux transporter [Proteobacteria bacterium]|nr:MATE family efflux transporter [Pseudomonadota bacterium]